MHDPGLIYNLFFHSETVRPLPSLSGRDSLDNISLLWPLAMKYWVAQKAPFGAYKMFCNILWKRQINLLANPATKATLCSSSKALSSFLKLSTDEQEAKFWQQRTSFIVCC